MKRLLFSDIHFHTWPYGATVTERGMNSRLQFQWDAAMEMVNYASDHNIQYAYFLGDLFHTHQTIPVQALEVANALFKSLRSYGIHVRSIVGNHDMASRDGRINSLAFINHLNSEAAVGDRYTRYEHSHVWHDAGLKISALSYTTDEDRIKKFLDDAGAEKSVVLMHQGVAGIPLSSGFIMDERLTPDMIPDNVTAFTGHYHFHKRVTTNLTVVGNLTPLNWNDIDQTKGWVIYDDETGEVQQVPQTTAPGFHLVGRDMRQCPAGFIRVAGSVKPEEQEEVRNQFLNEGALTVEFPLQEGEVAGQEAFQSGEEATLAHLIDEYEKKDMEPRRREIGQQIREARYVRA